MPPTTPDPQLISVMSRRQIREESLARVHQNAFLEEVGPRVTGRLVELGGERHYDNGRFFPNADAVVITNIDRDYDERVDITAMPYADATQDAFLCLSVLEHMTDPLAAVREIRRCLRPGGLLVVTVPFLYPIHDVVDWWRPTPKGLVALVGEGFEVESLYHLGGRIASVTTLLQRRERDRRGRLLGAFAQAIGALARYERLDSAPLAIGLVARRLDS